MARAKQDEVWTTGEISEFLGIAPRTVSKLIDNGKLKGWRLSTNDSRPGDRRVNHADFLEYLREVNPRMLKRVQRAILIVGAKPHPQFLECWQMIDPMTRIDSCPSDFHAGIKLAESSYSIVVVYCEFRFQSIELINAISGYKNMPIVAVLPDGCEPITNTAAKQVNECEGWAKIAGMVNTVMRETERGL